MSCNSPGTLHTSSLVITSNKKKTKKKTATIGLDLNERQITGSLSGLVIIQANLVRVVLVENVSHLP